MLPHLDGLVLAPACHRAPVTRPIEREHLILMARQIHLQLAGLDIPQLDRGVLAGTRDEARVRGPCAHVHGAHVAAQRGDEFPILRIPQLHAVVEARARDVQAVGREGDVQHLFLVSEQACNGFRGGGGVRVEGRRVPQEDSVVVAGGDEALHEFALV